MKTFAVHILHRQEPVVVIGEDFIYRDGTVVVVTEEDVVAEFERPNVAGVVVVSDDEAKGELQ